MNVLALVIGTKRTGVAFMAEDTGVPVALDTIPHDDPSQLVKEIIKLKLSKNAGIVVLGMPLLLSGKEGKQAQYVKNIGEILRKNGVKVIYVDERYTTPKMIGIDKNSASACNILAIYKDQVNS